MRPVNFVFALVKENFDKIKYKARGYFFGGKVFLNVWNWKDYYFDCKNKLKEKFITYKLKNNLRIITRTGTKDRDIFADIFFGNEYFTKDLILPENAVVLDIGAHIGVFSVFISGKSGKVFAFEPFKENFVLLQKNIQINGLQEKVFVFNSAVSDKKGRQKFFLHSSNTGANSFFQGKGKGMLESIEVQSTTLKEVFEKNKIESCDLMKVDIEGSEYPLFYSLREPEFKKIKLIAMECHRIDEKNNNPEKLVEFLQKNGFEIKKKRESFGMLLILAENAKS